MDLSNSEQARLAGASLSRAGSLKRIQSATRDRSGEPLESA